MKILFICPVFQPYCPVAATRPPLFAKYLLDQGHEVRVVAAHNKKYEPLTLPPVPAEFIDYADMWQPQEILQKFVKRVRSLKPGNAKNETVSSGGGADVPVPAKKLSPTKYWINKRFDDLFNYPDAYVGWIENAVEAGNRFVAEFRPDMIFSTAPPHSSTVVASRLSKAHNLPWVAEYRDLWMAHPYHNANAIRRIFETRLENRSVAHVDRFVAVSADAKAVLEESYKKHCVLALNGFNPQDFDLKAPVKPLDDDKLSILYAGSIYPESRDPTLLFNALAAMGERAGKIAVHFYTQNPGWIIAAAERLGVSHLVEFHAPVPASEIVKIERQADVLLLMRWDDPREDGVIAGKVFEYIGAGRPVLSTGRIEGEVGEIFKGRPETLLTRSQEEVIAQLDVWLEQRKSGRLPDVNDPSRDSFTRDQQFEKIDAALKQVIAAN